MVTKIICDCCGATISKHELRVCEFLGLNYELCGGCNEVAQDLKHRVKKDFIYDVRAIVERKDEENTDCVMDQMEVGS